MNLEEKKKDLKKLIANFCKTHNLDEDEMGFTSENEKLGVIEHIRTGNAAIDTISNGGIIKGKVNIIYGGENAGKSTVVLGAIAQMQADNPDFIAAICDNEKVFDRIYAKELGIDLSRLILSPSFNSAEQAYDFCLRMSESGAVDALVVDTIQALASESEMRDSKGKDRSTSDNSMALIPRLLSQFLRMYTASTKGNVTLMLLSQVRLDLGGMSLIKTAKKTGGKAIDHYNILTLKLAKQSIRGQMWPWSISSPKDAPPKSYPVLVKVDKAKMEGRYDGNEIVMLFHKGKFERKINILNIAKQVGLTNGKTLKYMVYGPEGSGVGLGGATSIEGWTEKEVKGQGFKDLYNKVPDEAIDYLETKLVNAYTKLIQFDSGDINDKYEETAAED